MNASTRRTRELSRLIFWMTVLPILAFQAVVGQDPALNFYYGNLHAHTSFSDGSGTPDEAFEHAKLHLDFIAVTEHNHDQAEAGAGDRADGRLIATNHQLYEDLKEAADRHNDEGSFVTFWGQEFSTISKGNHANVFFVDDVLTVGNGDYKNLFSTLSNELLQFNHPWDGKSVGSDYGLGQFHGSVPKLAEAGSKNARLIEIINGPGTKNATGLKPDVKGEGRYKFYLTRGLKVAPTADQDNHYVTWGDLTDARTVVLAPELTRSDLLQALRKFRCYASTDRNIRVTFRVNDHQLGSSFTASSRKLKLTVSVEDPDEPQAKYRLQAVYGSPLLHDSATSRKLGDKNGDHDAEFQLETEFDSTFVYLRVVQHPATASKTDTIVTAPIWVTINQ